ncbi:MAG: hypothetical protein JJT82_04025 [Legionellaceae bacterium]|nr:hypothetical protein [Legionellaceae bacterium]
MTASTECTKNIRQRANNEISSIKAHLKQMNDELASLPVEGEIQNHLKFIAKAKDMTYDLGRKSYLSSSSLKVMVTNTKVDAAKQQKYFRLSKRLLTIYGEIARLQYLKSPLEGIHKNTLQQTYDEIMSI